MQRKSSPRRQLPPRINTKRSVPPRGGFWFRAVTRSGSNRQRARTSGAAGAEGGDTRSRAIRGILIIFAFHIIAVALYFVHLNFLGGAAPDSATAVRTEPQIQRGAAPGSQRMEIISSDDTWQTIAVRAGVSEASLRQANIGRPFENGRSLIIPDEALGSSPPPSSSDASAVGRTADDGLVDVLPEVMEEAEGMAEPVAPRAIPVPEPAARTAARPAAAAAKPSGRTHKVKSGDTLWRICSRYKVDQRKLMELNGIKDPNKLKAGATLRIPE